VRSPAPHLPPAPAPAPPPTGGPASAPHPTGESASDPPPADESAPALYPARGSGPDADPEERARQLCLRLLTSQPRTRSQLASAMRRRGVPDEAAATVLARFTEVGLIDDALFARAWVESRHHGKGLARRALSAELKQRGVDAPDIKAAVSALDPAEEIATARRLVDKALGATRGKPLPVRVRRLVGVLARKGYPAPVAYRVVRDVLEQEGTDAASEGIDLDDMALTTVDADEDSG
jgi:regulatory protein